MIQYLDLLLGRAENKKYARWCIRLLEACQYEHKGYTEKHHILPKCLFPEHSKDKDNLIKLSAREHYIAHLLLYKAFPSDLKMAYAFFAMINLKNLKNHQRYYKTNNRIYETVRIRVVEDRKGRPLSEAHKEKLRGPNFERQGKPLSEAHKEKLRGVRLKMQGRPFSEAHKEALRKPKSETHKVNLQAASELRAGKFTITFPDGHEETITNLNRFCREHNLENANIYKVINGKCRHHKGFRVVPVLGVKPMV